MLLSQEEQLAAMSAPGSDHPQVIVLRAFGSSPMAEPATSVCEPSCWRSSRPTNWSGSPANWTLGSPRQPA